MDKIKTIFLTGATGFVGSNLAYEFLKKGYKLKLLVRDNKVRAEERMQKSLSYLLESQAEYNTFKENIEIIHGDIIRGDLGIRSDILKRLRSEVDVVFHNAALTDFKESTKGISEKYNMEGTKNVLDFTLKLKQPEFHHMSSAYVCGDSSGVFSEDDLDIGQSFNNPYEKSKLEAEQLIEKYTDRFSITSTIYRPSIIVGDTKTGKTSNFLGVYSFIKAIYFLVEIFSDDLKKEGKRALSAGVCYKGDKLYIPIRIPAESDKTLNVVPIDYVVSVVMRVMEKQQSSGITYQIVNPSPPTISELNDKLCSVLNVSGINIVEPEEFKMSSMTEWEKFFLNSIQEVVPYLQRKEPIFYDENTRSILNGTKIKCPRITNELIGKLVSFYIENTGFNK